MDPKVYVVEMPVDSRTLSEHRCGTHLAVSPAINITVFGRLCSEREYQRHFP